MLPDRYFGGHQAGGGRTQKETQSDTSCKNKKQTSQYFVPEAGFCLRALFGSGRVRCFFYFILNEWITAWGEQRRGVYFSVIDESSGPAPAPRQPVFGPMAGSLPLSQCDVSASSEQWHQQEDWVVEWLASGPRMMVRPRAISLRVASGLVWRQGSCS